LREREKKLAVPPVENVPGADATDDKQRGFQSGKKHVQKAIDHEGIENGLQVVTYHELPIDKYPPCRRL
jgi:hypothetical protein